MQTIVCTHVKIYKEQSRTETKANTDSIMTDEYTKGFQIRLTLVLDDNSRLLALLMTEESTPKKVFQPPKLAEDKASDSETPVSQVTPLRALHPEKTINSNTGTLQMTFRTS